MMARIDGGDPPIEVLTCSECGDQFADHFRSHPILCFACKEKALEARVKERRAIESGDIFTKQDADQFMQTLSVDVGTSRVRTIWKSAAWLTWEFTIDHGTSLAGQATSEQLQGNARHLSAARGLLARWFTEPKLSNGREQDLFGAESDVLGALICLADPEWICSRIIDSNITKEKRQGGLSISDCIQKLACKAPQLSENERKHIDPNVHISYLPGGPQLGAASQTRIRQAFMEAQQIVKFWCLLTAGLSSREQLQRLADNGAQLLARLARHRLQNE
jgi:hypothetical protein